MTKKEIRKILKKLELKIVDAIFLLENAPDSHNCGSWKVKVCWNGKKLWNCVEQANTWTPGSTEILGFKYSHPEYNTEQSLLDESGFEGTIKEWDWDSFLEADFYEMLDRLLEEAKENLRKLEQLN